MQDSAVEQLVDTMDLRELQIESALVIANCESTSGFIKKFSADHDSHQFYKNVILWYIKESGSLPSMDFHNDLDKII